MEVHGDLQFIVSSPSQFALLRELQEHSSPVQKSELVTEDGPSRSTIDRGIENLTERNWAEEKGRNRYDITSAGEAMLHEYDRFHNVTSEIQTVTKLLNQLGDYVDPPSIEVFAEAETTVYPNKDPMKGWKAASEDISKQIETGIESYQGMNSIVSTTGNEMGQKLLSAANEAEVIVDKGVLNVSKENYSDALDTGIEAENFEIYVSPEEVPITLAIYDHERIDISIHDEEGHPIGGIRGSDPKLVNWATSIYTRYQKQTTPLSKLLQSP